MVTEVISVLRGGVGEGNVALSRFFARVGFGGNCLLGYSDLQVLGLCGVSAL